MASQLRKEQRMNLHGSKPYSLAMKAALRVEVKMVLPNFNFIDEEIIVHHYIDTLDYLQLEYELYDKRKETVRVGRVRVFKD